MGPERWAATQIAGEQGGQKNALCCCGGMGAASCRSQLFIPVAKPRNPATGRMVRTSSAGNGGQSSSHTNPRVQTGNTHLHTHTPWDGVHICL